MHIAGVLSHPAFWCFLFCSILFIFHQCRQFGFGSSSIISLMFLHSCVRRPAGLSNIFEFFGTPWTNSFISYISFITLCASPVHSTFPSRDTQAAILPVTDISGELVGCCQPCPCCYSPTLYHLGLSSIWLSSPL